LLSSMMHTLEPPGSSPYPALSWARGHQDQLAIDGLICGFSHSNRAHEPQAAYGQIQANN
jgi:hypothetical protein